jgi:PIN domain nuclease of toxin-antitoxin system
MIVLDTQSLIWWLDDSPKLSRAGLSAIRRNDVVVIPAICSWEMARLQVRGKVRFRRSVPEILREVLQEPGVRLQPLTIEIGVRAGQLSPNEPMDPADQLVAATALVLRAPLVTSDDQLHGLPGLQILW